MAKARAFTSGRWWVVAPVGVVLALAACSGPSGSTGDAGSAGGTTTPAGAETGGGYQAPGGATSGSAGGGAAQVDLGTTSLGDVVVAGTGLTLYMFDNDTQGSPSTCYDQCASAWPPLLTDGAPVAGDGVDASKLGTADRTDGTTQVTYDGWPLYYWAQDSTAGDVKGEGVNSVWWVLGADGQPIHG